MLPAKCAGMSTLDRAEQLAESPDICLILIDVFMVILVEFLASGRRKLRDKTQRPRVRVHHLQVSGRLPAPPWWTAER